MFKSTYQITEQSLEKLRVQGVPKDLRRSLQVLIGQGFKNKEILKEELEDFRESGDKLAVKRINEILDTVEVVDNSLRTVILWICAVALVFLFLKWGFDHWPKAGLNSAQNWGSFGDSFGGWTSLFSALAFLGLIWSISMQRKELALQRRELSLTRQEMIEQRKEFEGQKNAMIDQNNEAKWRHLEQEFQRAVSELEDIVLNADYKSLLVDFRRLDNGSSSSFLSRIQLEYNKKQIDRVNGFIVICLDVAKQFDPETQQMNRFIWKLSRVISSKLEVQAMLYFAPPKNWFQNWTKTYLYQKVLPDYLKVSKTFEQILINKHGADWDQLPEI